MAALTFDLRSQCIYDIVPVAEDLASLFGVRTARRGRCYHLDSSGIFPVTLQRRSDDFEELGDILGDAANEVCREKAYP